MRTTKGKRQTIEQNSSNRVARHDIAHRFRPTLETLEDRTVPSAPAPSMNTTFPNLIGNPNQVITIPVNVSDNDSSTSLKWNAEFGTKAYLIDHQINLVNRTDYITNWSGFRQEKWVQDTNGTWYFILPNGEFHLWNQAAAPRDATGPLLAVLDPFYYYNPAWLTDASNASNSAHEQKGLDMAFVLDTALHFIDPTSGTVSGLWENWGGRNERWILGTDLGGNPTWFFILPTGELFQSDGKGGANGWLFARLDPMYYQVEMLRELTISGGIPAPNPPEVTVAFKNASTSNYSNDLLITPTSHRGTISVQVNVFDGTGTAWGGIFDVNFRNVAPTLTNPGTVTVTNGGTKQFNLSGSDINPGDAAKLTYKIGFVPDFLGSNFLSLSSGNKLPPLRYAAAADDWGGAHTRWFQDDSNGKWYFMNLSGDFFEWYSSNQWATGKYLGKMPIEYVDNPLLVQIDTNAVAPVGATITVNNSGQVTATFPSGFNGHTYAVIALLSDGMTSTTRRFLVSVV